RVVGVAPHPRDVGAHLRLGVHDPRIVPPRSARNVRRSRERGGRGMSDLEARVKRLEDIHEIGQLRAKYCQYLDDGRWDLLAELFTEDGRFVGLSTATGRAELRTFFANLQNGHLSAWWHFRDRKSTRLNSSHVKISYAVFCLKKKN